MQNTGFSCRRPLAVSVVKVLNGWALERERCGLTRPDVEAAGVWAESCCVENMTQASKNDQPAQSCNRCIVNITVNEDRPRVFISLVY